MKCLSRSSNSVSSVRDNLPKKSRCSFGFCPKYLDPLPLIWTTCTTCVERQCAKKIGQGPPPLIWKKSERTVIFFRESVPNTDLSNYHSWCTRPKEEWCGGWACMVTFEFFSPCWYFAICSSLSSHSSTEPPLFWITRSQSLTLNRAKKVKSYSTLFQRTCQDHTRSPDRQLEGWKPSP